MPATELGQFWVSSYGGFLFRYDSFSGQATPVDYGLVGHGANAVLADETSVWFAPGELIDRYSITWADSDLVDWRTWESESIGPLDRELPSDPIHVLLRDKDDVWAGGDCVAGRDLTVVAVQDGKLAAESINREIMGL